MKASTTSELKNWCYVTISALTTLKSRIMFYINIFRVNSLMPKHFLLSGRHSYFHIWIRPLKHQTHSIFAVLRLLFLIPLTMLITRICYINNLALDWYLVARYSSNSKVSNPSYKSLSWIEGGAKHFDFSSKPYLMLENQSLLHNTKQIKKKIWNSKIINVSPCETIEIPIAFVFANVYGKAWKSFYQINSLWFFSRN